MFYVLGTGHGGGDAAAVGGDGVGDELEGEEAGEVGEEEEGGGGAAAAGVMFVGIWGP